MIFDYVFAKSFFLELNFFSDISNLTMRIFEILKQWWKRCSLLNMKQGKPLNRNQHERTATNWKNSWKRDCVKCVAEKTPAWCLCHVGIWYAARSVENVPLDVLCAVWASVKKSVHLFYKKTYIHNHKDVAFQDGMVCQHQSQNGLYLLLLTVHKN